MRWPEEIPELITERLILRGLRESDLDDVYQQVQDRDIAVTTELIPHPYEPHMAVEWFEQVGQSFRSQRGLCWAIALSGIDSLIGSISLRVSAEHLRANLGYWVGKEHWGRGIATEAAQAAVDFGFCVLKLNRIEACSFANNTASCRVLEKCGLKHEGTFREHIVKWGEVVDVMHFGLIAREYRNM